MRKQDTGLKLCPSCNVLQDATKTECPNCDYDLTKVMEEKEITMRPDDNIWKIALALVCIGILAYGFFYSKNTTTNLAHLEGALLIC